GMNRIINVMRAIMNYLHNYKNIIDMLKDCNQHCLSYEKRHKICDDLEAIAFGAPDKATRGFAEDIDFLHELIAKARSVAQRVLYEIRLEKNAIHYAESIQATIRYFLNVAEDARKLTCAFFNDNN